MNYAPLPATLHVGMKLACPKHYPQPCVYEVIKVDGDRLWIANEAGVMLHGNLTVQLLRDYDYQLVTEGTPL